MMKKKTKVNKARDSDKELTDPEQMSEEDQTIPQENDQESKESAMNLLCHPGEQAYQVLLKWAETNQLLDEIASSLQKITVAEERRNEIAEEDYSDEEED